MKVQFERDGVAVEAAAGPDGRVTMLDVSVADGALKLRVHPTMFDGRTSWTISGMPGAFTSSTFTAAWEHLYEVVHDGRTYDLRRAIAEIVDAQGTVTAPGTGMSAAIEKCKKTLSDFEHRYMAAEVVQLQRSLLADQGYSSGPDLVGVQGAVDSRDRLFRLSRHHRHGLGPYGRVQGRRHFEVNGQVQRFLSSVARLLGQLSAG